MPITKRSRLLNYIIHTKQARARQHTGCATPACCVRFSFFFVFGDSAVLVRRNKETITKLRCCLSVCVVCTGHTASQVYACACVLVFHLNATLAPRKARQHYRFNTPGTRLRTVVHHHQVLYITLHIPLSLTLAHTRLPLAQVHAHHAHAFYDRSHPAFVGSRTVM